MGNRVCCASSDGGGHIPIHRQRSALIVGAAGCLGGEFVKAFNAQAPDVRVKYAVLDPYQNRSLPSDSMVLFDVNDNKLLTEIMRGVDVMFINPLSAHIGNEDLFTTADLALKAKTVGVKHVVFLSSPLADVPESHLGRKFAELETELTHIGLPYTVLRCHSLIDNLLVDASNVRTAGTVRSPLQADALFAPLSLADIAHAATHVMANPKPHAGRVYNMCGPKACSMSSLVELFSMLLCHEVSLQKVSYTSTAAILKEGGLSALYIEHAVAMYQAINAGQVHLPLECNNSDCAKLLGTTQTAAEHWLAAHVTAFQPVEAEE
jgi:uncharacterized protein YbjT (DUF2867 family)